MKFLFALLAVAYAAVDYQSEFKGFLGRYSKVYEGEEVEYRFGVFKKTLDRVNAHNAGNNSWTEGINQFSDWTDYEFERVMLGLMPRENVEGAIAGEFVKAIDWQQKGAVTPVKNQGSCGSCWAFSTNGGLEGQYQIKKGKLQDMAEQALVDCSGSYGNKGCSGGLMTKAYDYIKAKGIPVQSAYPYTAKDGSCKSYTSFTKVSGHTAARNLESDLQGQPIAVGVDASSWKNYKSGVFDCKGSSLNHGVTLTASDSGWWKIKNSWGSSFGESGYMRINKAKGKDCGITSNACYPNL